MIMTLSAMLVGTLSLIGCMLTLSMTLMRAGSFFGSAVTLLLTLFIAIVLGLLIDSSAVLRALGQEYTRNQEARRELEREKWASEQQWLSTDTSSYLTEDSLKKLLDKAAPHKQLTKERGA